jgi:hypothetical protein
MEVLLLVILAGFMLWLIAVVDLIKATDMDMGGRLIIAGALLLFPPIGVLLWLLARQGKLGLAVATTLIVVTVVVVAGVLNSGNFHFSIASQSVQPMQVHQVMEVGGASQSQP